MVNGFREMDVRFPTHELYLSQNLDRLRLMGGFSVIRVGLYKANS
jgi:hypothetical protein